MPLCTLPQSAAPPAIRNLNQRGFTLPLKPLVSVDSFSSLRLAALCPPGSRSHHSPHQREALARRRTEHYALRRRVYRSAPFICSTNWHLSFSQTGQYIFEASRRIGRHDIRHRQRDVPVLQEEACVCLPDQSIFPL